ncbi:PP2C family serine/threonine-protein phosphatase [Lachnospiraceae bacterium HCP1S3_C3]|nr:protein phosphatase 2C domain-containing protein [Lachnospiraceae bacterium]
MGRYVFGKSVKGATHEKNGLPLQDNCKIEEISDKITIIAVADGHGSSKCPRSDRGSLIAVNTFCTVMKNYLLNYGREKDGLTNLVTFLNREGDMRFAQDICEEWQTRVKKSFYKDKDNSLVDSEGKINWKKVYSLYGTTLLGMLITDTFVFSFQIGDGDINYITSDEISTLVEPEKFLGTETHSLSKTDAWRKSVASVRRKNESDDAPYLYMLSTDGFSNSFVNEDEFHKTCREYYKMISEHGYEAVRDNLAKWLKETSELGCGDDITVVMAYIDK